MAHSSQQWSFLIVAPQHLSLPLVQTIFFAPFFSRVAIKDVMLRQENLPFVSAKAVVIRRETLLGLAPFLNGAGEGRGDVQYRKI